MSTSSSADRRMLKRQLSSASLDELKIARAIFSDAEMDAIKRQVIDQMAREGKLLHDGHVANRFGGEYAMRVASNVSDKVASYVEQFHETVSTAVCLKYCQLKKKGTLESEGFTVAVAVADALLTVTTSFPVPATMVTTYIIKKGILNRWCTCDP
jgi:hypothetical protein